MKYIIDITVYDEENFDLNHVMNEINKQIKDGFVEGYLWGCHWIFIEKRNFLSIKGLNNEDN